jgi:hypothetical protein
MNSLLTDHLSGSNTTALGGNLVLGLPVPADLRRHHVLLQR